MILMIYYSGVFQEYILPKTTGIDYDIKLKKDQFRLKNDVVLNFECVKDEWFIKESVNYNVIGEKTGFIKSFIKTESITVLKTFANETIRIIAEQTHSDFQVYKKVSLCEQSEIAIGTDSKNGIRYSFMNFVSKQHARIVKQNNRWIIYNLSVNGTFINGRNEKSKILCFGDEINIFGLRLVFLDEFICIASHYGAVDCTIMPQWKKRSSSVIRRTEREQKFFNRSPRNIPTIYNEKINVEFPPQPQFSKKKPLLLQIGPSFSMVIPMLLGCGLAILSSKMNGTYSNAFMFTGIIMATGAGFFGALWGFLNLKNEKKTEMEAEENRCYVYSNYLINISNDIKRKYIHNYKALNRMYPSAKKLCNFVENSSSLWNRNQSHNDFLFYRLGIGNVPFQIDVTLPAEKLDLKNDSLRDKPLKLKNNYNKLINVPIGIDLKVNKLLGIVGECYKDAESVMYNIVAGIAANNSYTDVKMIFIYDKNNSDHYNDWDEFKWFPHVWYENKKTRYLASDANEATDVFYELSRIIKKREALENESRSTQESRRPVYIMFVASPIKYSDQFFLNQIFDGSKNSGMVTIVLSDKYEKLPNGCEIVINNTRSFRGIINIANSNKTPLDFDKVSFNELIWFGKKIFELQIKEFENDNEIPNKVDFFDMFNVSRIEQFNILDKWYKNRTYYSMKALIGKKAGGADCYLDIHEKAHGPHGLVAGTTGSGKSELLQTFILSMAINYSPDDVVFFLIDFKGGEWQIYLLIYLM